MTRTVSYYPLGGAMRINISGGSNTLYYLLKDHLGSASVVTDASGTIIGEDRFYPYGETRFTTGSMNTDKLFTSQREMIGLGIYHYGARFYSPKLGRFLSPDTIVPGYANPQAWNRYSYTLNNPIRYSDPSGHYCVGDDEDCVDVGSGTGKSTATPPPTPTQTPSSTPSPTSTPTPSSTPCPVVVLACQSTATNTPIPTTTSTLTATSTPYTGPVYTTPSPPQPYLDIDWNNVDKLQAGLDVAGIVGDAALIAFPEGPGEVADAVITFVEVLAAGKAVIDAAQGGPQNLMQTIATNNIETNLRLLARSTRWVPLAGSVASGYSLYDNFKGDISVKYK